MPLTYFSRPRAHCQTCRTKNCKMRRHRMFSMPEFIRDCHTMFILSWNIFFVIYSLRGIIYQPHSHTLYQKEPCLYISSYSSGFSQSTIYIFYPNISSNFLFFSDKRDQLYRNQTIYTWRIYLQNSAGTHFSEEVSNMEKIKIQHSWKLLILPHNKLH